MKFWIVEGKVAMTQAIVLVFLFAFPVVAASEVIFQDGFETGDLKHSENGFIWHSPDSTGVRVVRDDGYIVSGGKAGEGPFPESRYENAPESSGRHALEFYYSAMSAQREKRFTLGGEYSELWIRYWLRVPVNFTHENPSGSSDNNKLFALWVDGYTVVPGTRFISDFRQDPAWEGPNSRMWITATQFDGSKFKNSGYKRWITVPEDRGRWMQIVYHLKMNDPVDVNNGRAVMYRRWQGETEWELFHEINDIAWGVLPGGNAGWTGGYLMGWSNSAYAEDTEFLLDDFTVSTSSLLDLEDRSNPRAPTNISVD